MMKSRFVSVSAPWLGALALVFVAVLPAAAQQGASLSGTVTRAGTGDPLTGATVILEELRRTTRTAADGSYRFDDLEPAVYHISVRAQGYSSRRAEVEVGSEGATLDVEVEFDLHFYEVVSVSPSPRPQFEAYQPTSVLAGQDLARQLEGTIGGTLASEPGIAVRSLGPGPARPVIRGLDGDRIVVLQDGQRTGDLSSQSGDHGVTVNPASAQRIEVVRGPATLLYGANAIGGLVNVITDQIPTEKVEGASGNFTFDFGSNAGEGAGAGDVHWGNGNFALHLGGGGRRTGEFSTPEGEVDNSQSRSGFFSLGGAWTGDRSYVGASFAYDDTKYGIPFLPREDDDDDHDDDDHDDDDDHEEVTLTPTRQAFTFRAGARDLDGVLTAYRGTLGVKRYEHTEFEDDEVGTIFNNDTIEGELLLSHRPVGRLSGTVGGWFLNRDFQAVGPEALSPPIDQRGLALFLYEEVTWPHATLQFGGRLDRTAFEPSEDLPNRDFTNVSGSLGLLVRPEAASDNLVLAASVARAARNPALEELYFFGPHPGNLAFEIGNPDLRSERALGVDVSVRARAGRVRGEVTVFRNDIKDFIFRNPISEDEFEDREDEFEERFGHHDDDDHHHGGTFPFVEFVGADSVLWGFEAHADVDLTPNLRLDVTYDWVRGQLKAPGRPLPRIPPYRVITGLRYRLNAFQAGGSVTVAGEQSRVSGAETTTDGYAMVRLFTSYSFQSGGVLNTVTARLDNATDKLYRNHLNFLKDDLPEIGRNFKLVYSIGF